MKKRVHKNQIVITTLAVLIAVAGYVTYDKKGADIKDAETVANMNQGAVSDQADKDYETGEDLDITSSKEDLADALFFSRLFLLYRHFNYYYLMRFHRK